jgi:hypothetical protein
MPVRVRYKLGISISSSSSEENDLGNAKYEVVDDTFTEGWSGKTTVPALAVNQPVNLPALGSMSLLILRATSKDPTLPPVILYVRRNSVLGEELPIKALGNTKEAHFLVSTEGLTSLYVSNPSNTVMDLLVHVVGD